MSKCHKVPAQSTWLSEAICSSEPLHLQSPFLKHSPQGLPIAPTSPFLPHCHEHLADSFRSQSNATSSEKSSPTALAKVTSESL